MLKTLVASAIAAVSLSVAPAAADPQGLLAAGTSCGLLATETTEYAFAGVIYAPVAAVDAPYGLVNWHVLGNPVHIEVRCDLRVNGGVVDSAWTTGDGVAVVAKDTRFTAFESDIVSLCTTWLVTHAGGGGTETHNRGCKFATSAEVPAEVFLDTTCTVLAEVPRVWALFCGPAPVTDIYDLQRRFLVVDPTVTAV